MRYEYECPGCGNVVEIERKISDPEGVYDCPQCSTTLNRKFTAVPVTFHGKGFYTTDNPK